MIVTTAPYIHPTLDNKICNKLQKFFENEKWNKKKFEKKFYDIVEMMKLDKNKKLIIWIATNIMDGDGYYYNNNNDLINIWDKYEKQGKKLCNFLFSIRLLRFIKDKNINNKISIFIEKIINICNNNVFLWKLIGLIIDKNIRLNKYMNDFEKFLNIFIQMKYFPDLDIIYELIVKIIGIEIYAKIATYPTTDIYKKAMKLEQRIFGIICQNKKCNKKQNENNNKFKMCSQCKSVWYCSSFCQKMNWSEHRYICQ